MLVNFRTAKMIIRQSGKNLVCIDKIIRIWQTSKYVARAYEMQRRLSDHGNRIQYGRHFFGDVSMRKDGKEAVNHKDAYTMINTFFPELAGKGSKESGTINYEISEINSLPEDEKSLFPAN